MNRDWRLEWAFPALGRMPTALPWRLAPMLGRDAPTVRRATERFLVQRFGQAFPAASEELRWHWARMHMAMVATEMLDAAVLHRLGVSGGPRIDLQGWEHVQALQDRKQGFILVLNHYDRLLAAAIALAHRGLILHILTMPVADNPDLSGPQRDFILKKISALKKITKGQWRLSSESLRPVHQGLRNGQTWVILADAWSPDFAHMREHAFIGGLLSLPTGIERLAQSTGAALLHGRTFTRAPDRLEVRVDVLPEDPRLAIDTAIQCLDRDVCERPWAWWHWGMWDQMWQPAAQDRGE